MRLAISISSLLCGYTAVACGAPSNTHADAQNTPSAATKPSRVLENGGATTPSANSPPAAAEVVEVPDNMKIFDNEVVWKDVPTAGLPAPKRPTDLRPFGRFPELAFVLMNHMGDVGVPVPGLYAFDAVRHRWRALDFFGAPRIGINAHPAGKDRWILIRRGFGAGGYVAVEAALVGADIDHLTAVKLPCTSFSSGTVEPTPEGGWAFRCGRRDGSGVFLLDLVPGVLTGSRRNETPTRHFDSN